MIGKASRILRQAFSAFIADEALTRGAAIAFYSATSIAPLLLIVIAIAGLVFGRDAAQGAVTAQLTELMGRQTASMLEAAITSASDRTASKLAGVLGIITLLATASGAFGEIQSALNVIWKAKPQGAALSRLLRARAASLGLVVTVGFLLVVSLVVSAAIAAFSEQLNAWLPFGGVVIATMNFVVSFVLIALMFAAVYKVLPDRALHVKDVLIGAALSALLFVVGKSIIAWYIGISGVDTAYGAAGSLIILLLWVYYSVQVFLFGAEIAVAISKA
jgi:membrane protein